MMTSQGRTLPKKWGQQTNFYNRDSLLWISTFNISAPFDWKSTKIRLVVVITPRSKKYLWVMAKILATSELEAKESGIFLHFWFSWFFPCSFSQNWWGAQTWTIKYHIDFCHRRVTKKNSWSSDVGQLRYVAFKIVNLAIFWVLYLSCPTSELHDFFV